MRYLGLLTAPIMAMAQPAAAKASAPIYIAVGCSTTGSLETIEVAGRKITIPAEDDDKALRSALPDLGRSVTITNNAAVPWRCIGGLIFKLQMIGYRRVGFISEPPPGER